MADIQPLHGLRYNQSLTKNLRAVICPPYDIIPPSLHEELLLRSEYNFIRLEDSQPLPQDSANDNKYTRASALLQRWLKERILVSEENPAIYIHDHYFQYQSKEYRRRGIIARVRLEEWEKGIIRPHEGIIAAARDDRLNLLWALEVNTSPILAMYEDEDRRLASLLEIQERRKPIIRANMPDGERHVVRSVIDSATLAEISRYLAERPLYIADGHHRYTSALTYRREKMACTPDASSNSAFNFVMMTLVSFSDPGLMILAPHRLIRGIPGSVLDGLESRLGEFFHITKLALSRADAWTEVDKLVNKPDAPGFAYLSAESNNVLVLTLRDQTAMNQIMPYFHSELYRKLDVSIIDHVILEKILGMGIGGTDEAKISYSYDRQDAVSKIMKREFQLALLLKTVKPELIKTVADAGDKMPRKSTYFYPKAPAGLVVNPLTD
jgi:uncharacterized protein (DUF1015 family)